MHASVQPHLQPQRGWVRRRLRLLTLLFAPVGVVLAAAATDVCVLAAQSTDNLGGKWVDMGLGMGVGTGRFGGPAVAAIIEVGDRSRTVSLGGELVGVFRREHFAEGGAFFPDPGRTRTIARWAASVVARYGRRSGPFGKVGIGIGAVGDIDTSVLDASPLKSFVAFVTTAGFGARWPVGSVVITPRADLLFHIGHGFRLTGVAGATVAFF